MPSQYSFCEAVTDGSASRWHIRELSAAGLNKGGGADTPALCGRVVSWDIECRIDSASLFDACQTCKEIYLDRTEND